MKKMFASLLAALSLCVCLAPCAFAASAEPTAAVQEDKPTTLDYVDEHKGECN